MRRLQLLTTSAAKSYRRCPRLYQLSYELCYRTATSAAPLAFGTLGHHGLEAWWIAARDYPETPDTWRGEALAALRSHADDAYDRAKASAIMVAYHERWKAMEWDGQPMRVLAVEAEFRGPLINPATGAESRTWERGGKIDFIVEVGGRHYTGEHKTSSENIGPGSDYWARLRMDSQVSNYHVGARMLGYEPVGCIYDVLRKPQLTPRLATPEGERKYTKATKSEPPRLYAGQRTEDESPDEYHDRLIAKIADNVRHHFDRCEVVRLESEEEEAGFDTWQTAGQIRESQRLGKWPRNPDACMHFGRACGFFPVCTGAASLEDGTLYRRAERAHEELAAEPVEAVAAE